VTGLRENAAMTVSYDVAGDGPPVLLLHAAGVDGRMWEPLVERLRDSFGLVVPDLRGHGRTPLPAERFSYVDDVRAVLDELGLERAAVVGASLGGQVGLALATAAPERVSALVLLASSLSFDDPSPELAAFWAEEERLLEHGDVEGAIALSVRDFVREPATAALFEDMARRAFAHQLGADVQAGGLPIDLAAIAVPTLAVSGGRDVPDFARLADRIAAGVPGARRAEVADAGHLIALERPDAAAELVRGLLATVPA
jgi:3-oxoadipate enol-lactonase